MLLNCIAPLSFFTVAVILINDKSFIQATPFFEAYWLGTSILGMIRTAVVQHYDFELVLWLGLEPCV